MATKKKVEYTSKAVINRISVTSRAAVKVRDNFYTVEYFEERSFPANVEDIDMEKERKLLWDTCNTETDRQIEDIFEMVHKK